MNIDEILATLQERRIMLSVVDGDLRVRGDERALSDGALMQMLREHKDALVDGIGEREWAGGPLAVLRGGVPLGCDAIRPEMLSLASLSQHHIDRVVRSVPGGARNVQDIYPLAPLQEGIVFHHLLEKVGDPYLSVAFMKFESRELLTRYVKALEAVIVRHDILRTAFQWRGLPEPVQVVWRSVELQVDEVSVDDSAGDVVEQLRRRFNPRAYRLDIGQAPLMRLFVARDSRERRWVLLSLQHHLLGDNASAKVMRAELRAHLGGEPALLSPAPPFRDFVARARFAAKSGYDQAFFSQLLGDVTECTAPYGLTDVQGDGAGVSEARRSVEPGLSRRIRERARALGVSAASLFHVAWAQVLARTSGRDDVVFGTVMLGRMQGGESSERALGMFINTLPIRIRVGDESVESCVRRTHQLLTELLHHEHASLASAQRCSKVASPAVLFSSLLNYKYIPLHGDESDRLWEGIEFVGGEERTNYPLTLSVDDFGVELGLVVQVREQAPVTGNEICELMEGALGGLVEALEECPEGALEEVEVMSGRELERVVEEWNSTAAEYSRASIDEQFEEQVSRQPEAAALSYGEEELSYGELNERANAVAQQLQRAGVRARERVGLCAGRGVERVIGLLGLWKQGCVYVPLDPEYPSERLRYMSSDSELGVVLVDAVGERALGGWFGGQQVKLSGAEAERDAGAERSAARVERSGPRDVAYVIYTSGSSGEPKGVENEHGGLSNLVGAQRALLQVGPGSRVLQFASMSFDASVWDTVMALGNGATLCLGSREELLPGRALLATLRKQRVTHVTLPPSVLSLCDDPELEFAAKTVVVAGEAIAAAEAAKWSSRLRLINAYGPTETTVCATAHECVPGAKHAPIGTPIANARVYLLDARLRPVPVGVAGEIYIGGAGVARGYLKRPELTAERFVRDPFSREPAARMYRSGDLGRRMADGAVEFLGRNDEQVKIRGYRIELGEIEMRLREQAGVGEVVVLAREDEPGDRRLVAYYTGEGVEPGELTAELSKHLPEYMVPAAYVRLETMPLTMNGKVDRKSLPAPEREAYAGGDAYEPPVGEVEQELARLWEELLRVERVGRHDNFFELGGHSLLAVSLMARMRSAGLHADVRAVFATPTLKALAEAVGGASGSVEVPPNLIPEDCEAIRPEMLPLVRLSEEELERIIRRVPGGARNVQDIYPLAPLQEGILFHHLLEKEGDPYLLQYGLSFATREHLERYVSSQQRVIERHDILRTGVEWEGLAEPVQVVWREARLVVEEVELEGGRDVLEQLQERFDPRRYRLDISQAPLMRLFVSYDATQSRWVALVLMHHLWADHTALEAMQEEVEAHLLGETEHLPRPLPFRNFVAQARLGVSQAEHEQFFGELLGDVTECTAPYGLTDVQGDGAGVSEARRSVEPGLSRRIRERARALGVSAASLFHVAWAQVLARTSGRDDVVFGTVLFGRMQGGDGSERVLGMFINTLPLRIRVGDESVESCVRRTHQLLTELLHHEHASLTLAQRCSGVAAPAPLFSALLNYRHIAPGVQTAESKQAWEGVDFLKGEERTNYPLTLSVDDFGVELGLVVQVREQAPVTGNEICELMEGALGGLVEALEECPEGAIEEVEVMSGRELERVVEEWNSTAAEYSRASIDEQFEEQVSRQPEAAALSYGEEELSYGELNERANAVAQQLQRAGVRARERVGLCAGRGVERVIGLLGLWKQGCVYVPLDPEYPSERLRYMSSDSELGVVLVDAVGERALGGWFGGQQVKLSGAEAERDAGAERSAARVGRSGPRDVAYVIYTSGSSGEPKGVENEHGGLSNLVGAQRALLQVGPGSRVLQFASMSFDASVWDTVMALGNGATLCLGSREELLPGRALLATLRKQRVTHVTLPPSVLSLCDDPELEFAAKTVVVAGEAIAAAEAAKWSSRLRLINAYGPTETTVCATAHECVPGAKHAPIGTPIANARVYLLDARLRPVPVGVAGEIYIGGAGVARGYLKRPELTAERFVRDPFSREPGARMYRSGDLGRRMADGAVEFLGRNDEQVKIRGYRIELGEIEMRLREQAGVGEVVVLAREDEPGDRRLVAYYTGEGVEPGELTAELSKHLPEYMVPAAYVRLETMPLTMNGKVDRKSLPAPEREAYAGGDAYEPPVGEVEQELARLWEELLRVERVGRHDNFFELGGHSLLAVSLMARMRSAGLHADVRAVFATPTLKALAEAVGGASGSVEVPPNLIPEDCEAIRPEMLPLVRLSEEELERIVRRVPGGARNVQDIYPLAPLQEGILFHHLLEKEGDPYLLQYGLSFATREHLERYVSSQQRVIERHDILRTGVEWEGLAEPVQVVWREARLVVEEVELEPAQGDILGQLKERFDPRHFHLNLNQAPLMRLFSAYDAERDRWVALGLMHHLWADHTTLGVMQEEVEAHLLGETEHLPRPLPFRNFVAQARLGVSQAEHEQFFGELLGDVTECTAPYGLTDVQGDGAGVSEARRSVEPGLSRRIRERARALGVSAASLFHVAWAQVLARTSGRDDVVFGTVLFGRMQGGDGSERVLGMFINTLPLRIRVGDESVESCVRRTHQLLTELLHHEHASLAVAQRCSGVAAPAPLFSALLNYRHSAGQQEEANSQGAWDGIEVLSGDERTNYPFTLSVDDFGTELRLTVQVLPPAQAGAVCELVQTALRSLLQALELAPQTAICSLQVVPSAELECVLSKWNATAAPYRRDKCVHELFEEHAAKRPTAVALVYEDEQLSYGELNQRANRIARYLMRRAKVRPGVNVALCMERGIGVVVGMLAILKSGGAYLPLDPRNPLERIAYLLADAAPIAALTNSGMGAAVRSLLDDHAHVVDIDSAAHDWASESAANIDVLASGTSPMHSAYVIYTSGSTGRPKGVLNQHRGLSNLIAAQKKLLEVGPESRVLQFASQGFDASVWEMVMALGNGATLCLASRERLLPGRPLLETLGQHHVTHVTLPPSALAVCDEVELPFDVATVVVAGETLGLRQANAWSSKVRLFNAYGPSEATVCATIHRCTPGATRVSIGRPIPNVRTYILDGQRRAVPVGVSGEIYIGGHGVARGYLNRPELTSDRFMPDPFQAQADALMYKTGDLARWLPDGSIEFLGRTDFQIKIRGHRIEPGEVEACLTAQDGVKEAIVVALDDQRGDRQLVAYFTTHVDRDAPSVAASSLSDALANILPDQMIPSAFVWLPAMPLNVNGKLERSRLPPPRKGSDSDDELEDSPQGELEHKLARIWCDLLSVKRVGRRDNFFELGGHSLLAMRLMEHMRREGLHCSVRDVFASPTLAGMVAALRVDDDAFQVPRNLIDVDSEAIRPEMLPLVSLSQAEIDTVVRAVPGGARNVQDIYPLAPLQEGMVFHHLLAGARDPYWSRTLLRFDSRETLERYLRALESVIARHDILRTAVQWEGLPEPLQVVWRRVDLPVEEVELGPEVRDVEGELQRRYGALNHRLGLARAPLIRLFAAADRAAQGWVLLSLQHHLLGDNASAGLMSKEIQAHLLGEEQELPAALPYRNFVARARLGTRQQVHQQYFQGLLGDIDECTAPFGLTDLHADGVRVEEASLRLTPELAESLRERARAMGVTVASLCHVAWALVLARTTRRDDVVFGTVLLGRMQSGEAAEHALGMFINTLPTRVQVGADSVATGVRRTHEQLSQLLHHELASLSLAQRCSGVAPPAPLFTSLLNYRNATTLPRYPSEPRAWAGIEARGGEEKTHYPVTLSIDDTGSTLSLIAQVHSSLEPHAVCETMQCALAELTRALEHAPDSALSSLDVLPRPARERLLMDWNATVAVFPREKCVHSIVEEQARARPDSLALVDQEAHLTYAELNARANRLAQYLLGRGVNVGARVGVLLPRSSQLVIAELAILKCGAAYVPLDETAPRERLEFMVNDCGAALVLTHSGSSVSAAWSKRVALDELDLAGFSADDPALRVVSESPAYIMYTSGSTGRPKGVEVPHRAVGALLLNKSYLDWRDTERVAFVANPVFDPSTLEVWGPLFHGGCIVVVEQETLLDPERLEQLLQTQGVTLLHLTSGLFSQYATRLRSSFARLRYLLVGGDVVDAHAVRRVLDAGAPKHLIHAYGPTETTLFAATLELREVAADVERLPIGRPIANTRMYVLDERLRPVPVGATGEIFISGAGIALGYLNRPELTAERFIPEPLSGVLGSRMYRTGDLGKWRPDGSIEFLGRSDQQVKVRGFRIELGEVEARLRDQPGVDSAFVLMRDDDGARKLVAYYTLSARASLGVAEPSILASALAKTLPEYMLPAAYVVLTEMPLTANGKLDRSALPRPDSSTCGGAVGEDAPRGVTELSLARIWVELLKVERVGRRDNFFARGGNSLLAVSLMERMRREGMHADVRAVFSAPTLMSLAATLRAETDSVEVPPNGIPADASSIEPEMVPLIRLQPAEIALIVQRVPGGARNVQDIYPLAPLQEGIVFHHLLERAGDPYLIQYGLSFDTRERLQSYIESQQRIIERHDILRTAIQWEGLSEPVQVVWRHAPLVVEELALEEGTEDVYTELRRRFDPRHHRLDLGHAPLMRWFVARDSRNARWVALVLQHHLLGDNTSARVMMHEVRASLAGHADELPPAQPFRNFVAQARLGVSAAEHERYFRGLLGDVAECTAPYQLTSARADVGSLREAQRELPPELVAALRARAKELAVSCASLCHVAWASVLARVSGRDDVVFGTVLLGRMQGGEGADRALGMFINTLPVRIDVAAESVERTVKATHQQLIELLRHEHAALALAQRCSGVPAPAPLFTALFNFRHAAEQDEAADIEQSWPGMGVLPGDERTNYPFNLSVDDFGARLALTARVQDTVDPCDVCELMERALRELEDALATRPSRNLGNADLLSPQQRELLTNEWNANVAELPTEKYIHELVEQAAAQRPDAVAVVCGSERIDYATLDSRANQLAHALRELGVAPDTRVGVFVERSVETVVLLLGILKAGGAYVPLDPEYPAERLAQVLDDAAPLVALYSSPLREDVLRTLATRNLPAILSDARSWEKRPATNLDVVELGLAPEHLAYVIYTSGSTGVPKGVAVAHRNLVHSTCARLAKYPERVLRALAASPFTFDGSVAALFWTMSLAGTVVLPTDDEVRNVEQLAELAVMQQVTHLPCTASVLLRLLECLRGAELPCLRVAIAAGEPFPPELLQLQQQAFPELQLYNEYGPTEATVWAAAWQSSAGEARAVIPIGKPIQNMRAYVVDARLQLVPPGAVGELMLSGLGVARGYLNNSELTAERFLPDPFANVAGARMYRTGDLARHAADGSIEFIGRRDSQVKIRGFRIELQEIETHLLAHPKIKEAVVVAREDVAGDKRLVAYYTTVDEHDVADASEGLHAMLSRTLPSYMVPTLYVALAALPLTSNGKLDRRGLPAPNGHRPELEVSYCEPSTPLETALAKIWCDVLQLELVGVQDNFFALGGHSLLAVSVLSRIRAEVHVELPLALLFEFPTVRELASQIALSFHGSAFVDVGVELEEGAL